MVSDFGVMLSSAMQIMQVELTLWGFTFSLWQIFLFGIVASIVIWVLWEVLLGD